MKFEIWLGPHYSHFDRGMLHLADGSAKPLKGWIHSATYGPDTMLIADEDGYIYADFPVRWYIEENGLTFYCWGAEVKSILLHNGTGKQITVGGYGVLPAGESREYTRED